MSAAVEPVAGQCDADRARQLTVQIKRSVEMAYTFLREAFDRRAWAALGYPSWEAYCEEELQVGNYRLPAEMRQRAVAELTAGEKPMSNRAVASALGVHHSTVAADRAAGGGNPPPEAGPDDDVIDAEIVPDPEPAPEKVTGADGKRYPAKAREVPAPKPRRRPLPDAFREAVFTAQKDAGWLRRLVADDRFAANKESISDYRHVLARLVDELHEVHDAVTGSTIASDIVEAVQTPCAEEDRPEEMWGHDSRWVLDGILLPDDLVSTPTQLAGVDLGELDSDNLQRRIDELAETEAGIRGLRTAMQRELSQRRRIAAIPTAPTADGGDAA